MKFKSSINYKNKSKKKLTAIKSILITINLDIMPKNITF